MQRRQYRKKFSSILFFTFMIIVLGCYVLKFTGSPEVSAKPSGILHFSATVKNTEGVSESCVLGLSPATGKILYNVLAENIPKNFQRNLRFSRPAWSPDGSEVVFDISGSDYGFAFVRADREGRSFDEIVRRKGGPETPPKDMRSLHYPEWSPDGKRIAFIEESPIQRTAALLTVDRNGENLQKISDLTFSFQSPPTLLTWSQDGDRLAIGYLKGLLTEERKISEIISEIRFVSLKGDEIPTMRGHHPAWLPDRNGLAYVSDDPATILLLDFKTMVSKPLHALEQGLKIRKMTGSPNGDYLCYLVSDEPSDEGKKKLAAQGIEVPPPIQHLEILSLRTGEHWEIAARIEKFGASELYWTR